MESIQATGTSGPELELDEEDSETYRLADLEPNPSHSAGNEFTGGATAIRTRPSRRKKTSAVMMLVQWIGGGVAGVAIALVILWYLDRLPQIEFIDQFTAQFHSTEIASDPNQPTLEELGVSATDDSEFQLPESTSANGSSGADQSDADLETMEEPGASNSAANENEPEDLPEIAEEANDVDEREVNAKPAVEEENDARPEDGEPSVTTTPPESTDQIAEKIAALNQELERLDELDGDAAEVRQRHVAIFQQLTELGAAAAESNIEGESLTVLLGRILRMPQLRDSLLSVAPKWIAQADRPNDGVVIDGVIKQEDEDWILTTDSLTFDLKSPPVQSELPTDTRVLIIGKLDDSVEGRKTIAVAALESFDGG